MLTIETLNKHWFKHDFLQHINNFVNYNSRSEIVKTLYREIAIIEKKKQLLQFSKLSLILLLFQRKTHIKTFSFKFRCLFSQSYRTMSVITMTNTCMHVRDPSGANFLTMYTSQRMAEVSMSGEVVLWM